LRRPQTGDSRIFFFQRTLKKKSHPIPLDSEREREKERKLFTRELDERLSHAKSVARAGFTF